MKRKCHQKGLTLSSKANSGFSLVELLVVIGVMSLLVTVTMVNMQGFNKSGNLTAAGNQLVDMANQARQLATTKNVNTALVIISKATTADSGKNITENKVALKTFCLMQYLPTATSSQWQMVTRWQSLPASVTIDNSDATIDVTQFLYSPTLSTGTLSAKHLSKPYTSSPSDGNLLAFQVFTPEGSMETGGNIKRLKLVPDKNGVADTSGDNFYEIVFNPYTGSTKVFRPGEEGN